ncbi:E3 ubiquitin-protein ligase sspH2 [compost metagenome]
MATAQSIPTPSIDHLIARQLPAWLTTAETHHISAYHQALRGQQQIADDLQHLLGSIPDIEDFAAPLLEQALQEQGLGHIDTRRASVVVSEQFSLPSAAEKLYKPKVTYSTRQSLLAAALHNFEEHEAQPWLLRKAHLVDPSGVPLAMTFERFVGLTRTLDIGEQYQSLLKRVLRPNAAHLQSEHEARSTIEQLFQGSVRTRMQISLYQGRLKGELDEQDLQRLQKVFKSASPTYRGGTLTPRQLYLLGKCMVGVVAFEWRPAPDGDIDEIIVWIPDDPEKSLRYHDSWDEVYSALSVRLQQQPFRRFFGRFIKAQDRSQFDKTLKRLLTASEPGKAMELDGRNQPVDGDMFAHVRALLMAKIFDDARYLAVPTGVEDRLSRHKRLQEMLSAGLDLLGLAAFFVPGLGEVMLVVGAVQLLGEVYEGYQDWQLGDRQEALDHLFNVAQGLVLAGVTAGAGHALRRLPFVDELAPKVTSEGGLRLVRAPHYAPVEEQLLPLLKQLQGEHFAGTLLDDASIMLEVTGVQPAQLRRLSLEHAAPPARLLDIHERIELGRRHPALTGSAFEHELQTLREPVSDDQKQLMEAFIGLSPKGAQEILDHSSSSLLETLRASNRVPLSMAERARWYIRDSRVDKACLGIRLHAMANADTEKLVLGLIERKAPWSPALRVELREGSRDGRLLFASQGEAAGPARTIIRHEQGYALAEVDGEDLAIGNRPLLQAVLQCLDESQKTVLGNPNLQVTQLRTWLLEAVAGDREQAARLIGLTPVGAGVRPPRRFADGRLAYPLSGGGESSQQAIRRGIHQIFPTLSEMQLDAYIEAVRQRGGNLWDHYQMLQRQLTELREALRQWQAGWQSPIDAIRRRRVADALRRSWRRKLVDSNDQYELTIDGEQVGALPALPAGIDFVHVRRLALRNMQLPAIDAQFLSLFPNLVDLDLSGNQLAQVPDGIERLTQLRRVDLGNNHIVMDEPGSLRLAQLRRLDTLILSYNPLNGMPDLSVLPHVRDVRLRSTGQVDIRQVHENLSLRSHIDLRDNRISELQREMRGLRLRLQRLNLHDNPLTESSVQYLDEARGFTESGARGSAAYTHGEVDEQTRANWVMSRSDQLRVQREATWDRLIEEPGSGGLFRFLADFAESEDFEAHPRYFRRRIWRILDACENNEALREMLFREADAPRSCEDRLLLMLNQLEVGILAYRGIEGIPVELRENRLLRLGRQLHRLDLLDEIANRHVQRLRQEGLRRVDEIEVRLYYRSRLAGALDLPVPPDEMHFASFANVTMTDLSHAELEVLRASTPVAMLDALVERPFWQSYLRETFPERFEALGAPYHDRLEVLEEQARAGQEQEYDERARTLMQQHAAEESTLMRNLTTEVWARSRYATQEQLPRA